MKHSVCALAARRWIAAVDDAGLARDLQLLLREQVWLKAERTTRALLDVCHWH